VRSITHSCKAPNTSWQVPPGRAQCKSLITHTNTAGRATSSPKLMVLQPSLEHNRRGANLPTN
jgi:hypothetical protein